MLVEEANGAESESETADERSTESSQENEIANTSTSDETEPLDDDRVSSVSLQLEEPAVNSLESSSSDSSEDQPECAAAVIVQGDEPSIDSTFAKFNADVKQTK